MAKYGGCLSTEKVCSLEVKEAKDILGKYKVSAKDVNDICDMIIEPYYQLKQAFCYNRLLEDKLGTEKCKEIFNSNIKIFLNNMVDYEGEEK